MADQHNLKTKHRITVCTKCRHVGRDCLPGHVLMERLRAAIEAAGDAMGAEFEISGADCMAGCDRPCTVAYQANRKASYLFGEIESQKDIDDLLAFAKQYAQLADGWSNATDRPLGLIEKTLARLPAAILAGETKETVQIGGHYAEG